MMHPPTGNEGSSPSSWLPIDVFSLQDEYFVKLKAATSIDLDPGFFKRIEDKHKASKSNTKICRLTHWFSEFQQNKLSTESLEINLIFHVSRCGSTLLSQNLKSRTPSLVLGEPKILAHALNLASESDIENAKEIAQALLVTWQHYATSIGKQLLIKATSALNNRYSAVIELTGAKACLFLVREPVAVLNSLSNKPAGYLLETPEEREQTPAEHVIFDRAYTRYLDDLLLVETLIEDSRFLIQDYRDLAPSFTNIATHLLGKEITPAPWCDKFSAKAAKPFTEIYKPKSKLEHEQFFKRHPNELERAQLKYERLREQLASTLTKREA